MTQRRRASSHCGCRACPGNPFHHPHEPLRTALWTLGSSPRVTVERWQWTVRHRQTLRERLEGAEGEGVLDAGEGLRSEEHTSELQSLMRISYAVFCVKKKQPNTNTNKTDGYRVP